MLDDETARPIQLPLSFLKDITKVFSDGQLIGKGGFGAVYKVCTQLNWPTLFMVTTVLHAD